MSEADDITAALRAAGRLHTRVDAIGISKRGAITPSMLETVALAQRSATTALDELVRLTRAAVVSGAPTTTTHSEPIQQARAGLDQALAKLDAVLFDVVATAEAS